MAKKTTLLFDLGGVIVPWIGLECLAERRETTRENIIETLSKSEAFNAYEAGKCNDSEFCTEMIKLFEYDISPEAFALIWNSWVRPPFPGVVSALQHLKRDYTLACLSNTNVLHWTHLKTMLDLEGVFDHCFASHLIGVAKPAPESYFIPLKSMGVNANDIVFFDDTKENVNAARKLGITSYLVDHKQGVIPTLRKFLEETSSSS